MRTNFIWYVITWKDFKLRLVQQPVAKYAENENKSIVIGLKKYLTADKHCKISENFAGGRFLSV